MSKYTPEQLSFFATQVLGYLGDTHAEVDGVPHELENPLREKAQMLVMQMMMYTGLSADQVMYRIRGLVNNDNNSV